MYYKKLDHTIMKLVNPKSAMWSTDWRLSRADGADKFQKQSFYFILFRLSTYWMRSSHIMEHTLLNQS